MNAKYLLIFGMSLAKLYLSIYSNILGRKNNNVQKIFPQGSIYRDSASPIIKLKE